MSEKIKRVLNFELDSYCAIASKSYSECPIIEETLRGQGIFVVRDKTGFVVIAGEYELEFTQSEWNAVILEVFYRDNPRSYEMTNLKKLVGDADLAAASVKQPKVVSMSDQTDAHKKIFHFWIKPECFEQVITPNEFERLYPGRFSASQWERIKRMKPNDPELRLIASNGHTQHVSCKTSPQYDPYWQNHRRSNESIQRGLKPGKSVGLKPIHCDKGDD